MGTYGKYIDLPDIVGCMDGGDGCSVIDEDNIQKLIDWCEKQLAVKHD